MKTKVELEKKPAAPTALKRNRMESASTEGASELLWNISVSLPLGIYILQGEILQYTNPWLQKFTGYSQRELSGKRLISLVSPEDTDVVRSSIIASLKGNTYPCEYRIINREGQVKWVMQTVSTIHHEGRPAVLGNLMDITERKYLERKMIEYEELSKMKSDLLATVSHELRTPLATIKAYSTLILDYYARLGADETKDYLKSIDISTDRLTKLVDNLLDTSRIDAGLLKLEKTPTDIVPLINAAIKEAGIRAEQYRFLLKSEKEPLIAEIDSRRIRQVIDNLVDNAIKYSPEGTEIQITAGKADGNVVISITDQGPGIPADELKNIFERMYRIEQRLYSGAEGIGLGLHICQKLVQAHGGEIWAESVPGRGSTFIFTLPINGSGKKKTVGDGKRMKPRSGKGREHYGS
jgi:PAS domain S-box-containing protein